MRDYQKTNPHTYRLVSLYLVHECICKKDTSDGATSLRDHVTSRRVRDLRNVPEYHVPVINSRIRDSSSLEERTESLNGRS